MELQSISSVWDFKNPAETEKKFRDLMQNCLDAENMDYYLEVKTQLARTFSLRLMIDKAKNILDEVKSDMETENSRLGIRYNLEYGRALNSDGYPEEAFEYFKKAMNIAEKLGEEILELDAIHMLGIAASTSEEQIKWNKNAIEKVEKSNKSEVKSWLGPLYNNTAWSLFDMGKIQEAKDLFNRDVLYRRSINRSEQEMIALWSVARMDRALGNIDKALQLQHEIEIKREKLDLEEGGYNYEELGELYLLKDDIPNSKKYFAKAYAILSEDKWLQKHEPERLERMNTLSR